MKMLAGVLVWEGQFQISKFYLRNLPENDEKERTYKRAAASYVVSFVHAFFLSWAGWRIVYHLHGASERERFAWWRDARRVSELAVSWESNLRARACACACV